MRRRSRTTLLTSLLLVVGGLNWGLVGLLEFDLVAALFGEMSVLSRIVYGLVGLSALWQIGDLQGSIDLLVKTNRFSEAVLFSQTYKPSATAALVKQWKAALEKDNKSKVAKLIGAPPQDGEGDEDMFPEWDEYLRMEREGGVVEDLLVQDEEVDDEAEEEVAEAAEAVEEEEDEEDEEDEDEEEDEKDE